MYRENVKKKIKVTLVQALRFCTGRTAYRRSRGIALPFHDHGTRRGLGVSVTPRPIFTPRERTGTHCTGGWVGLRAGLDGWKISPLPGFDPQAVQSVSSRYTDYATRPTPTECSRKNHGCPYGNPKVNSVFLPCTCLCYLHTTNTGIGCVVLYQTVVFI